MVSRIVDCESPARGAPPNAPTDAPPRRRPGRAEESRHQVQAAAVFADAALRRVLEVIDRRRPLAQLRPLLAAGLVETLLSGASSAAGVARLRRVRAQVCRPGGGAAEVAAHYTRGPRVHAIACRVEQVSTPTGTRWQMVALHLG